MKFKNKYISNLSTHNFKTQPHLKIFNILAVFLWNLGMTATRKPISVIKFKIKQKFSVSSHTQGLKCKYSILARESRIMFLSDAACILLLLKSAETKLHVHDQSFQIVATSYCVFK